MAVTKSRSPIRSCIPSISCGAANRRDHPGSRLRGRARLLSCVAALWLLGATPIGAAASTAAPAIPAAAGPAAPGAPPTNAADLAAYLAAVEMHLGRDPALATAYTVFWSELKNMAQDGQTLATVVPEAFADLTATGRRAADSVRQHYRGMPPTYAAGEALQVALLELARQRDPQRKYDPAERLLANLDRAVAPRVLVNGRYEYAGNLRRPTDLGFGAEVWLLCRQSTACTTAHDALFAPSLAGAGLTERVAERLHRDTALAGAPPVTALLTAAADLDARLAGAIDSADTARDVADRAAREYWRAIAAGIPVTRPGIGPTSADPAAAPGAALDPYGLQALFTLGRAGAYLSGQEALANAFAVTRAPAIEFASAVTQGALLGTLGTSAAGVGLLFAGVQALALFDAALPGGRSGAPAELQELVIGLNETTYRRLERASTEQLLASNAIDTRVAALGVALDIVKTDVARLENSARRRIGSDYQAATARRWTTFDEDNERCFGPRYRDPRTGRLRANDFRRCEDQFLQGATRRSQYATRATEYVLDARFIEPADVRFPFHDHYPLLATRGGLDARSALALPDPLDWQQHSAALLRLYQENPAQRGQAQHRRETLAAVLAAGQRVRQTLLRLTLLPTSEGTTRFRGDLHEQALDEYFTALERFVARVDALDDPAVHPFGKRVTEGLEQALPLGTKRAAIDATLAGDAAATNRIETCADAPDSAFEPQPDRLLAESRRFFGDPIQPAELVAAWNRGAVDALALQPASYTELVPGPYLWAALEGLGRLEVCLAQFRPEAVAFTRDPGPQPDTLLGSAFVGAELEVRFVPEPAVARAAGSTGAQGAVVARFSANRACTFGYRNDDEPCSRAECLPELVPLLWRDDDRALRGRARCEGAAMVQQFAQSGATADETSPTPLRTALDQAWRARQQQRMAQLEADVLRTEEYERAAALYLEYYALAGITLGTYPDDTETLGGLFGAEQALTPRSVLTQLLTEQIAPAVAIERIRTRATTVRESVKARGLQIEGLGREPDWPHLHALAETIARVELASAAYSGR